MKRFIAWAIVALGVLGAPLLMGQTLTPVDKGTRASVWGYTIYLAAQDSTTLIMPAALYDYSVCVSAATSGENKLDVVYYSGGSSTRARYRAAIYVAHCMTPLNPPPLDSVKVVHVDNNANKLYFTIMGSY